MPPPRRRAEPAEPPRRLDPLEHLGDIDAWNLRAEGGWLRFDARLEDGTRGYMRPLAGGDIIADAPGPLLAVLGIGGARRAGFNPGAARHRHNVLVPADDVGSVGLEGSARAERVAALQHLPHRSREALLADALLEARRAAGRGLPLMFVRAETDGSASVRELATGIAFDNLMTALDNLCAAAATLGRRARVLAIGIGYGLEDIHSDAATLAQGLRDLMARIEAGMARRALAPPVFLMTAEAGTERITDHPAIRACQELAWLPGRHRLIMAAPAYMAAQDRFGRSNPAGREVLAAMEAAALLAEEAGEDWHCPLPLLAEYHRRRIRVIFRAAGGLVVDPADPFRAGPGAGFTVTGTRRPAEVRRVTVARDDPAALILDCTGPLDGPAPRLWLASGGAPASGAGGANRSGIRDGWCGQAPDGSILHRWALPAEIALVPAASGARLPEEEAT